MLRGIPDIIGSDLLKALADTGHGDIIAIVDHFYPPVTKAPNAISIQAKGTDVKEMLDAILQLVPLDVDFSEHPIQYMIPDGASGAVLEPGPIGETVKETVKAHGYNPECVGTIERLKYYEKARDAYVVICTSERQPYGCVILQKGVM